MSDQRSFETWNWLFEIRYRILEIRYRILKRILETLYNRFVESHYRILVPVYIKNILTHNWDCFVGYLSFDAEHLLLVDALAKLKSPSLIQFPVTLCFILEANESSNSGCYITYLATTYLSS